MQVLRTRPMIMHKVNNPRHVHFLHWRVQHCGIPPDELNDAAAVASAAEYLPSRTDMYRMSTDNLADL